VNTSRGIFLLKDAGGSKEMIPVTNDCGVEKDILSLAIHKDTVYYNNWQGQLKRFKLNTPNSCEILMTEGASFNSMTIDKNGIIYMATETLVRYDPYKKELTQLGPMPYYSIGDMFFYNDKLLLAGWNPQNWMEHGLYEIVPENLSASKLFMETPEFYGLMAYPVSCGSMRYYGISAVSGYSSQLIELDLSGKTIVGEPVTVLGAVQDGASVAATEDKVSIQKIVSTIPDNCSQTNGSILFSTDSWMGPLKFTHINTGLTQPSGQFQNLTAGSHSFRITNILGCFTDTSIILPENIPLAICNQVFVPNAFTPNRDGRNDNFEINLSPRFTNVNFQVFNRGGTKVFESRGNSIHWDGYYRGTRQPVGVYVYSLLYNDGNDKKSLKGTITLIQ
jgi:gliding motility-associated-like protein